MSQAATPAAPAKKLSVIEMFMAGAKKGFYIGVEQILPAMVLGYVLVEFLTLTGLVDLLGKLFGPVLAVFGLPGEAVVVLIAAFFAKASGAAAGLNMYNAGQLSAAQATVCIMPSMLMGTLVGHYARIVLVADANPKYRGLLLAIPLIDSALGMLIVRILLTVMGVWTVA